MTDFDRNLKSGTGTEDYTVQELIGQLMTDDSWEPDPDMRARTIGELMQHLANA